MKAILAILILAALTHASGLMPKVIRAVSDLLGVA